MRRSRRESRRCTDHHATGVKGVCPAADRSHGRTEQVAVVDDRDSEEDDEHQAADKRADEWDPSRDRPSAALGPLSASRCWAVWDLALEA